MQIALVLRLPVILCFSILIPPEVVGSIPRISREPDALLKIRLIECLSFLEFRKLEFQVR